MVAPPKREEPAVSQRSSRPEFKPSVAYVKSNEKAAFGSLRLFQGKEKIDFEKLNAERKLVQPESFSSRRHYHTPKTSISEVLTHQPPTKEIITPKPGRIDFKLIQSAVADNVARNRNQDFRHKR